MLIRSAPESFQLPLDPSTCSRPVEVHRDIQVDSTRAGHICHNCTARILKIHTLRIGFRVNTIVCIYAHTNCVHTYEHLRICLSGGSYGLSRVTLSMEGNLPEQTLQDRPIVTAPLIKSLTLYMLVTCWRSLCQKLPPPSPCTPSPLYPARPSPVRCTSRPSPGD